LLLAAILCNLDPFVDEPDPDVVSPNVGVVRTEVFPHLFVDGKRGHLDTATVEQPELGLNISKEKLRN